MEREQYIEYLKSNKWKELRETVITRDKDRCVLCGDNNTVFNVHHNNYDNIGDEKLEDLITLCCECHKHFHLLHANDDSGLHKLRERYRELLCDFAMAVEAIPKMAERYSVPLFNAVLESTIDSVVRPLLLDS